ncbi:pyrimidine-specific ribonucleoside hydrolase RihB [bacterium BMS3Bbin02]|nr:pyrimidine-specific ribonucleoside hydrolase RihB [bacterium BMS3Bbin02]
MSAPAPFPKIPPQRRARLLDPPTGPVRVVIDTDTANEIDDQFALMWALQSPDRIRIEAVLAEPYSFAHHRPELLAAAARLESQDEPEPENAAIDAFSGWARRLAEAGRDVRDVEFVDPPEGMERSYSEILRVYDRAGADPDGLVFRGAARYMPAPDEPVDSPAVRRLIELALEPSDDPLYVVAIGCVTNVASAIVLEPAIIDRIVVLWTSGYPTWSPRSNTDSLNLVQDVPASRILFESGVPLIYFPGYYIGAQLRLSLPEMERWVQGRGPAGDFLHELYTNNPLHEQRAIDDHFGRTWVMWDMITIAWLIEPAWVPTGLVPTPTLDSELRWIPQEGEQRLMREAHGIDRDAIFRDFFRKLDAGAR